MKKLILALFIWVLFLLYVNAMNSGINEKRITELERRTADYELQIFQLKKEIKILKNPYETEQ